MISKSTAIRDIRQKIKQIDELHDAEPKSAKHIKWLSDTLYLLEDIFGQNSRIYLNFASINWQFAGALPVDFFNMKVQLEIANSEAYNKALEIARGILESGIEQISRKGIENVYEGKDTPAESSEIIKIISLIENKLRKTVRQAPVKEKEIQDALDNLFIGSGLDGSYTREKEHIDYSSKTYVPDFVFKRIDTIVEVKLCHRDYRIKEIISEINDDILAYQTRYSNLIFVVYDVGIIRDEDELKQSLESNKKGKKQVIVKVVKQ